MSAITSECLFGADATTRAGARVWGEMLLKGVNGPRQLNKAMLAGHLRAAAGGNERDLERVASARGTAFAKSVEASVAGHEDRADRAHALSAAQHRELARQHQVRQYGELSDGNLDGARAHQAASDAHFRAAALASDHDPEAPFASHSAREATRHANRRCREQVLIPGHAHKAAGGDGFSRPAGATRGSDTNFGSRTVQEQRFDEPRPLDPFHSSGRVSGGAREAGDSYAPDQPVHPLDFLLNPVNDPRRMNWPQADGGAPGRARSEGMDYPAAQPAKSAGAMHYDPSKPLTTLCKEYMASYGGSAIAKSLDLAHALCVAGKLPETAYRAILRLRDFKARATKATYASIQADTDYTQTVRAIRGAAISESDRTALLASIA